MPRPYVPHDRTLAVPESALRATLALLQQAGSRESGVFWYGQRRETRSGTVQAVIAHNLKPLAQILATRAGVSSTPARRRDGHLCQHYSATTSAAGLPQAIDVTSITETGPVDARKGVGSMLVEDGPGWSGRENLWTAREERSTARGGVQALPASGWCPPDPVPLRA